MNMHTSPAAAADLVPLRGQGAPTRPGPTLMLTPAKQAAFCRALSLHGNVRIACRAVGVSSQTAYRARRATSAFRMCWDAALLLARAHAEQVLADRALNGVEEQVFYHGEEVATRRRFDGRLLLAHLARLDRQAEAAARCSGCDAPAFDEGDFDAAISLLESGENFAPGLCSKCSKLGADDRVDTAAADGASGETARIMATGDAVPALEQRLRAMEAALPDGARAQTGMDEAQWYRHEAARLRAYEEGAPAWWLIREDVPE